MPNTRKTPKEITGSWRGKNIVLQPGTDVFINDEDDGVKEEVKVNYMLPEGGQKTVWLTRADVDEIFNN